MVATTAADAVDAIDRIWSTRATRIAAGTLGNNVLCISVSAEVHLALKGPRTEVTDEGLVAGVLASVRDQIGRLREGLKWKN